MAAIRLTIYNEDSEPVKDLSQSIVPWGVMKKAVRLVKSLQGLADKSDAEILAGMTDDDIDNLTGLVISVFGGRVTAEELERGATINEMLSVLNQIVSHVSGASQNPTPPGK